jgi:flagellar biosynthetic protein FliR
MILSRIGAVIMLFPGIGENYVPPRTRMVFACFISLLLLEPLIGRLPPLPEAPAELVRLVSYEIIIGLFFGTMIRLVISALEMAGMIIGAQTGLSNATVLNPSLALQSPLPSAFLSTAALAIIFASGMDHFLIRSMIALYDMFPPGGTLETGDMAQTIIHTVNQSFVIGVELSAPFLIMGLLFYTGLGIIQRLLPQVQVFIVSVPMQIWGGLTMFSLTVSLIMTLWMHYFDQTISGFLNNGGS